jgi:hypothetical protein
MRLKKQYICKINFSMATVTISYDARNTIAKKMVEALIATKIVKLARPVRRKRKNAIDASLQEAKEGKVTFHKSVKDIFANEV